MRKADLCRLAWTNLWRMRVRSILTIVGVVTGTAAVVGMIAVGAGMQKNLTEMLGGMGAITDIEVMPKYDFSSGPMITDSMPEPDRPLDDGALREIRKIDGIVAAVPMLSIYSAELTSGRYRSEVMVNGMDPAEGAKLGLKMDSGRYLYRGDDNVVVLGYKLPEQFQVQAGIRNQGRRLGGAPDQDSPPPGAETPFPHFGDTGSETEARLDLLHKTMSLNLRKSTVDGEEEIKTVRARVVGVLAETGGQEDMSVVIPLKMAEDLVQWRDGLTSTQVRKKGYESVKVRVESPEIVEQVQQEIGELDFESFSMKQMLAQINNFSKVVQAFLGGIGGIALLVASFGIVNTMVMSIYERTREIGIIKVIGASVGDIRNLFLLEAGTIGFVGGVIGLFFSWSGVQLINLLANTFFIKRGDPVTVVYVPLWLALFAVGFATMVGLLAGVYPALRAARLSPLAAIRQE